MNGASTEGPGENIGRRISRRRRAQGWTQQGLADRAFVSRSLIQQVETGNKPATPSLVAAVAAAFHVDPAELYGQPYRGTARRTDRIHQAIDEVRRSLACVDVAPELDAPPRTLDQLAAEIGTLVQLSLAARHTQLGARLPAVLNELAAHAYESESPRAWRMLNQAQAIAASLARRHGYNDLASLGIERAAASAARSDDPNLPRLARLSRALLMMTLGAWKPGLAIVRRTAASIDQDTSESTVVFGALQLRAAVLSARAGNRSDAWEHHGLAADIARRLPERVPDFYGLQFNPANVGVHGVAVAVELTDYDEAIRRDVELERGWRRSPSGLPAERRAHHDIDVGRALVSTGQYDRASRRLVRAARIAPQMTHYHPMARETAAMLADHYRVMPDSLRTLLVRMGLS